MPDVLLATCAEFPDGDEDAEVLGAALDDLGVGFRWVPWQALDPADGTLVVVRSTWDYQGQRAEFLAAMDALPRLANPVGVIAWSTDKAYLRELDLAGVPVVPSAFAAPGEPIEIPVDVECVVKPSVGAGSRGAGRFAPAAHEAARAHVAALHADGRVVLVQPYLPAVESAGETALIYLEGEFSHAIRKGPMLPAGVAHPLNGYALFVAELIEAREPNEAELAVGAAALRVVRDRFGADQLYARVDLLPGSDGPVVGELELAEPSLFLLHGSGAAERFAAAIAARA